jgi:hypothetical protein
MYHSARAGLETGASWAFKEHPWKNRRKTYKKHF